jgi:2-isopropylmalate synthase
VSVHCHNDLGLATANSLAAVGPAPARSSAPSTASASAPATPPSKRSSWRCARGATYFGATTGIVTEEIARTSRMVSNLTGYVIQRNKAIVGRNAFAHESGHPPGRAALESSTFEIMKPADVGLTDSDLVLGKHSGRHALRARLAGARLPALRRRARRGLPPLQGPGRQEEAGDGARPRGAGRRRDPRAPGPLHAALVRHPGRLVDHPTSQVEVDVRGRRRRGKSFSNGTVESVFKAIDNAVGMRGSLADYQVRSVTAGKDALAEVRITVGVDGHTFHGQAVSSM